MNIERLKELTTRTPADLEARTAYLEQLVRRTSTAKEVWSAIQDLEKQDQTEHADDPSLEYYERLRAKVKLQLDYNEDQENLIEAGLVERRTEEIKNKNGEVVGERVIHDYQSDYLKNRKRYEMPSWEECIGLLNDDHYRLYAEMKKLGLEPKLRCKPIDYKIQTLASKIDAHKTMPNQSDTFVWGGANGSELKYEPESYDASDPEILVTNGGKTKKEWIEENKGWIIEIVATKQDLDPHPDIPHQDFNDEEFTNAQKTEIYHRMLKNRGFNGSTYETYSIDQIYALKEGKPLEEKYWTILADSSLANQKNLVSVAYWNSVQVSLYRGGANYQHGYLRCRLSVRVKRKP